MKVEDVTVEGGKFKGRIVKCGRFEGRKVLSGKKMKTKFNF